MAGGDQDRGKELRLFISCRRDDVPGYAGRGLRRLDALRFHGSGNIEPFAGGKQRGGDDGDGGPATAAELAGPRGLAWANDGTLFLADHYVADTGNNRIRKITGGSISTVAGNGRSGYSGDGAQARLASLNAPYGVGARPDGMVVSSDTGDNQVRTIAPNGVISSAG